jgi:hypothetical protein
MQIDINPLQAEYCHNYFSLITQLFQNEYKKEPRSGRPGIIF